MCRRFIAAERTRKVQLVDGCERTSASIPRQKMQFFRCSDTALLASTTRMLIFITSSAGSCGELSIIRIAASYSHDSSLNFKQYMPSLRLEFEASFQLVSLGPAKELAPGQLVVETDAH